MKMFLEICKLHHHLLKENPKKSQLNQLLLSINIARFINFFYNIPLFNITNQQGRIRIMQLLVPFNQLHVGVGITHFKLSTTFSEICLICTNK